MSGLGPVAVDFAVVDFPGMPDDILAAVLAVDGDDGPVFMVSVRDLGRQHARLVGAWLVDRMAAYKTIGPDLDGWGTNRDGERFLWCRVVELDPEAARLAQ